MAKFRTIAQAEFYCYVEADSEEEALEKAKKSDRWFRTLNKPLTDYKVAGKEE